MNSLRIAGIAALLALPCLTGGADAQPIHPGYTSHLHRTYFGPPGAGDYAPYQKYKHPHCAKIFGIPCCKAYNDKFCKYSKALHYEHVRHQVELARLHRLMRWKLQHCSRGGGDPGACACGEPARCSCKAGSGSPSGGCCGSCGGKWDAACDRGPLPACSLLHKLNNKHHKHGDKAYVVEGPQYLDQGLPAMNREDALRYLEGFQYYPPYQLIRSPRDFFMFDVKYGVGF